MRVIAGTARRLQLKTIEGLSTRPTTDRIKETLFNMISPNLYDSQFLDLFAGSGGIGIEALSRGAARAVFVEKNPKAAACIRENLSFTRLSERAEVIQADVLYALETLSKTGPFDFIFMDPPYNQEWERRILERLKETELCSKESVIIVEASKETDFSYVRSMGYTIVKEKIYKTNKHIFLSLTQKD